MKRKINHMLVLIAVVAIIASMLGTIYECSKIFAAQVEQDLVISAKLLADTHYFESEGIDKQKIDLSAKQSELRVTWIAKDGTVLYDNDVTGVEMENHKDRPEVKEAFENGEGEAVRLSVTRETNTFYYAVLLSNGTVLRVSREVSSIYSMIVNVVPTMTAALIVILILCIALSRLLTRQIISPLEAMGRQISDVTVKPPYKELVPFANAVREQHMEVLQSVKARQDFTANVSHELKTPLTAISGYAELIENKMVDEEQHDRFIKEIRNNSERLLVLINDIIRLSELDRSESMANLEEIDLSAVASECVKGLVVNAEKRRVTLHYKGEECPVKANREMMRELLENLVQNAIRYNNEGGNVWVSVKDEDDLPILTVEDDGIGIPWEDQKRVFERFYRVDKSRSKATGGTGLGLAIVKHIVELHGASIDLESEPGKGTKIKVIF